MIRLFLFFMASVMVTGGTSMAENVSTCSVNTVSIQITYGTRRNEVTTLSAAKIIDFPPGFSNFVTAVTEHIAAKLAQENLCLDSTESQERSLLQFVPWPVSISEDRSQASVPPLEEPPSGVCRISSPWIDLVIERSSVPSVRGVVRYSERQLLADQAVLDGARNVPPGIAMPLTLTEFSYYVSEYQRSELFPDPRAKPVVMPIEERVPEDLLWLFRRAWQSTRGPFGGAVLDSMQKAMKTGRAGYTQIVTALIDHCFSSEETDIQYGSILDMADLVQLEQYKIIKAIR